MPSGPKRSATDGSGSAASAPAVRMPSASSSSVTRGSSPSRPIAMRPTNSAAVSASTTRGRPGRALAAAARAVKRPGPAPIRPPGGRQRPASSSSPPSPPCIRSSPSARNSARPGASGSTAAPIPSSPASSSSPASATAPGSAVTSAIRGQRAIASPARMPGRTPKVAAAAFTSPISGGPPASGASAAGASPTAPPIATRSAKRGTSAQISNRGAGIGPASIGEQVFDGKPVRRTSAGHVEPHLRVDRARVVLLDHGRVEHLAAGVAEEASAAVEPSQRAPVTGMATGLLGLSWHRTQASDGLGHGAR